MTAAEAGVVVQEEAEKKLVQSNGESGGKSSGAGSETKMGDDKTSKPIEEGGNLKSKSVDEKSKDEEKDPKAPSGTSDGADAVTSAKDKGEGDTTGPKNEKETKEASLQEKCETGDNSKKEENTKEAATEPVKEQEDPGVEAIMHLMQGKRHMLVQDFYLAVESLQKACELLAAKHGDDASECAEPLLYYGKALLELHRKESGALNEMDDPAVGEDDSSDDDDENDDNNDGDDEEDRGEKDTEAEISDKKATASLSGEEKVTDSDKKKSKDEEDLERPDPALKDPKLDSPEEQPSDTRLDEEKGVKEAKVSDNETPAENDEEDVSNLQIAFEVLDLAKKIYKRDAEKNPDLYLKAADCLLSLGEVGLESDTYEQAIEDFEECLRIQQEMLPRDARVLAETNYQLGLTYSFVNKYEKSAAYFGDALQILKLKVSNLKKHVEEVKAKGEKRGSLDDDPVWRTEREIEDIESLLPEIAAKLDDAKEMQRENAQGPKEQVIGEMMDRTPEASAPSKETKVNVISSSLIKRKRPLVEEGESATASTAQKEEKKLKEH